MFTIVYSLPCPFPEAGACSSSAEAAAAPKQQQRRSSSSAEAATRAKNAACKTVNNPAYANLFNQG
jgi:hypothetical protein